MFRTLAKRIRLARFSVAVTIVAAAALAESAMGRKLWGVSGQPGLWSGDIQSSHNSQYLTDPYTFSHLTHGFLLYGLTWLAARRRSLADRALIALGIESLWEVIENTDAVINRYRAATISLHYYGDSIMNSMCDVGACMAGFWIASKLPPRLGVVALLMTELALILWIRDSMLLNVLNLIYPTPFIKSWQAGN